MSGVGNSFFRVAGLSYNQYMAISARAFSKVLKPEAAVKRRVDVVMKERTYTAGKAAEKSECGAGRVSGVSAGEQGGAGRQRRD
jgi:hypothetical protein